MKLRRLPDVYQLVTTTYTVTYRIRGNKIRILAMGPANYKMQGYEINEVFVDEYCSFGGAELEGKI